MKPLKKSISVSLDEPVIEQIKLLAEEADRNFSAYVNIVLKQHIEKKAKESNKGDY